MSIIDDLKKEKIWVGFKIEKKADKLLKIPLGKSNDCKSWKNYDEVCDLVKNGKANSLGLAVKSGYTFVDFDHVITNGVIDVKARKVIKDLNGYTEISPSGKGVHVIIKGKLPVGGRHGKEIEMYDANRFFTFTGKEINDGDSRDKTVVLKKVHESFFKKNEVKEFKTNIYNQNYKNSNELIAKTRNYYRKYKNSKFDDLYSGEGKDASVGDLALCGILSKQTRDPRLIDAAFRASGRMREKWDVVHSASGLTYGQMTINKSLGQRSCLINSKLKKMTDKYGNNYEILAKRNNIDKVSNDYLLKNGNGEILIANKWDERSDFWEEATFFNKNAEKARQSFDFNVKEKK